MASVWQIRKLFALTLFVLLLSCGRTAQDYIERARKLAAAGKYADADLILRKAIQKEPRFGEAYYQLGLTELKLGHPREAYRALTEADTLLPARADVQAALGDLILKAYLSDRTRPKLIYDRLTNISQQLLAADPKSFDGLKIKACLAATDSKVEEALGLFQQANAVRPLDPDLTMLWAQTLTANRRDAEAEKLALELLEKNKSYGSVYDFLFRRYLTAGRIAEAQSTIERKVLNNPDEVAFALELAAYYASAGKRDQMNITIRSLLDRRASFPQVHLQVGDFYSGFQEWELALQQYDEGAKAHPKDKLVYVKRSANVWLRQGKGEQAAGMVDQILKENPQDEEGRAIKATLDMKSGDPKKLDAALSAFQDLVAKAPTNPVLRLTLGHAFMAKGNAEAARAQYLEILKRNNDYAPALLAMAELTRGRNEFTETLRYADELLKLNPNQRPARLLRAAALIGAGDSSRARNELTRVLKDFPGTREAELELASLDATQKKFPEAEARLRKLLAEKPGDPAALAALAETLTAAGQPRKALDLLSGELKRSPESEVTRIMLADTAARIGESDMAIEQYRAILAKTPRAELYVRLSSVYSAKGDGPNALASLVSAEKLAPTDLDILAMVANAYGDSGRKQEAIAYYRRILKLKPDNVYVMNNLAFLIVDTGGQTDEALRLAQQAIQKAPQQPNFSDTMGWIYFKQGLTDAALRVFRNLSTKYPDNPNFHYHLGMALRKTGDEASARMEFQSALSKKPSTELTENVKLALASQSK